MQQTCGIILNRHWISIIFSTSHSFQAFLNTQRPYFAFHHFHGLTGSGFALITWLIEYKVKAIQWLIPSASKLDKKCCYMVNFMWRDIVMEKKYHFGFWILTYRETLKSKNILLFGRFWMMQTIAPLIKRNDAVQVFRQKCWTSNDFISYIE